jgi:hypothetical protein
MDPDLTIVCFRERLVSQETLILVWDMNKNEEVSNISTNEVYYIIHGKNTKTAFLLMGENYANLDTGLTNFFFETNFLYEQARYLSVYGYRMNEVEDGILLHGNRLFKESYVEIETVMMYKKDLDCINTSNIIIDRIRF